MSHEVVAAENGQYGVFTRHEYRLLARFYGPSARDNARLFAGAEALRAKNEALEEWGERMADARHMDRGHDEGAWRDCREAGCRQAAALLSEGGPEGSSR